MVKSNATTIKTAQQKYSICGMYASVLTSSFPILPTTTLCHMPRSLPPQALHQLHNPFGWFGDGLHSHVHLCMSLCLALSLFLPQTWPPTLVSNCCCCRCDSLPQLNCLWTSLLSSKRVQRKQKIRLKELQKQKRENIIITKATTANLLL